MEELMIGKLSLIIQQIGGLTTKPQECCQEADLNLEHAEVVASKLEVTLKRFTAELHNYFRVSKKPSADVSTFSEAELKGEESLVELRCKLKRKHGSNTEAGEALVTGICINQAVFHGFWDQFQSNIGNKNLSDVDKLLYFKASLEGDAKNIVEGLATTYRNYPVAVAALQERYGCPICGGRRGHTLSHTDVIQSRDVIHTIVTGLIARDGFKDLLAVGLIVPVLMSHVRRIGGSHIHVGLLGSLYAACQFVSGPLIGSLSDVTGRKSILITTLLMSSLSYIVMGLSNSVYAILALRAVLGLFKQTQMLTKAMVADYEKNEKRQGAIYGKMMAVSGVGMTLGPFIGGHMTENCPGCGFSLVALSVGFCFLLNAGLVSLLPEPKQRKSNGPISEFPYCSSKSVSSMIYSSVEQSFEDLHNIKWSQYGDIFMFEGLSSLAMGIFYAVYGAYLKERYYLTPKYIGSIISFQRIVGSLSSYFINYFNCLYKCDKDYSKRNHHVFLLLTVALVGIIFSFNVYLYTFWLVQLSIGNAISRLITLEMLLNRCCFDHRDDIIGASNNESEKSISVLRSSWRRNSKTHRGKLIGVNNSVKSFCGVLSPIVAGVIGQWLGVTYVIYTSLIITTSGLILCYQVKQRCRLQ